MKSHHSLPLNPEPRTLNPPPRRGAALVVALVTMLVVAMIAGAVVQSLVASHRQQRLAQDQLQADWLATAGIARAHAQLARQADYTGETWTAPVADSADKSRAAGLVTIEIAADKKIIVDAVYPTDDLHRVLVRREILGAAP